MKYLLLVRILTIAIIYYLLSKFDIAITDTLSIFATILHELGHATFAFISGGNVQGYTLTEDSPHIFACTKGGSAWFTVFGGNLFSLAAAWVFVWLGRNGERQLNPILILLGLLMYFVTRLFNDSEIISMPIVTIYLALFGFFILSQSSWAGAFLIFFGFLNLLFIYQDTANNGVLADANRLSQLSAFRVHIPLLHIDSYLSIPQQIWTFTWLGAAAFSAYSFVIDIAETKVEWASGRRFFKNLDFDKILLFIEILPNLIFYAGSELFEFLVIQITRIFDFRQR